MTETTFTYGLGRRKRAVARVRIRPGSGTTLVNGRELSDYFPSKQWVRAALKPLDVVEKLDHFDIIVNAHGGGLTGQSEAVALGVARALVKIDHESWYQPLREAGQLTRDARIVERQKYGLRGARRAFQFSKR
ncbi:MAG: 30S ribosomal protein S9 [Planctomycetes bacterium]|nr:30S ribosomal protein S9 [Planctomycetota bacterium]